MTTERMMHPLRKSSIILSILLLAAGNLFLFYSSCRLNETYAIALAEGKKIIAIKARVNEITKELWGIVSVYDPEKSEKVKFSEGHQYALLREVQGDIREAIARAGDPDMRLQLRIIQRATNSLAKKIDSLKAQLALQEFDIESTNRFFRNSAKVSTLTDSYIDEMERLMEKIKIINGIISDNVNSYTEKSFIAMQAASDRVGQAQRKWLMINSVGVIILSLGAIIVCR